MFYLSQAIPDLSMALVLLTATMGAMLTACAGLYLMLYDELANEAMDYSAYSGTLDMPVTLSLYPDDTHDYAPVSIPSVWFATMLDTVSDVRVARQYLRSTPAHARRVTSTRSLGFSVYPSESHPSDTHTFIYNK